MEKLNNSLEHLIYDDFLFTEENIFLEETLCDIILDNKIEYCYGKKIYKLKKYLSLNQSINLCLSFLDTISKKYSEELKRLLKEGIIEFEKDNSLVKNSYLDCQGDKEKIKIYFLNNLNDSSSILHEFMHYLNTRIEIENDVTVYFTEAFSNWIELLFQDYVFKNYPSLRQDSLKLKKSIFLSLYDKNMETKLILEIIKTKLNYGVINKYNLFEIIKKMTKYCDISFLGSFINNTFSNLEKDSELYYIESVRNTLGIILACYMNKMDMKEIKKIFDLSDNLYKFDYEDVFSYLNLNLKNDVFQFTEEDLNKLKKSYVKELKR